MLSLAPFQGITDVVYRNLFIQHFKGVDKFYTPFFTGIQKDNSKSLRVEEISPELNDVNVVTPQILSRDADEIIRFAQQCKSMGYKEINLNMGCPFPRVANKARGCGLMTEPQHAKEMFEKIFDNIDIKFSIKCRLGYKSDEEIYDFLEVFNRLPFSEIIIHPRIGKQMYTGCADAEKFGELVSLINKPMVYNGDIFDNAFYESLANKFQTVKAFMLGRGLLTNPFLAEEIKNIGSEEDRQTRLHDFMTALFYERLHHAGGSPKIIGCMKELWTYTMNMFEEPLAVWRKIKKINALDVYEETVETIFIEEKLKV